MNEDRLIYLLVGLCTGFISNLIAEGFLTYDLRQPFNRLDYRRRWARAGRWVSALIGCGLVGVTHSPKAGEGALLGALALFGLFSVTAATDLETTYIPPDWFVYGTTIAGVGVGWALTGWQGLKDAVVAQAVCFAAMTLAVVLFRSAAPGDIKLAMQYGTVCGSLGTVAVAFTVEWVARVLIVAAVFVMALRRLRRMSVRSVPVDGLSGPPVDIIREAGRSVIELRVAHGPLAWLGVLVVMVAGV